MNQFRRREFLRTMGQAALAAAPLSTLSLAAAAPPGQRIKVGQIGTGHAHASGKMEALRGFSELYEVVGIVEPDPNRRAALAKPPYAGLPVLTEEQLLHTPGLQLVAVETEVRDLIPTAFRCAQAGLHLHIDKPAGESLGELRRLFTETARHKRVVQMGYMFRYHPAFQFCFQAVREGWLGTVFEAHGVMSKKVDAAARKRLDEYPGGSMFELGCHLIDPLIKLLGKPENVTPYVRKMHADQDSLADNQLAVFEYPKCTATIRSTLVEPHGGERRQFTLCGEAGTIEIRPLEPARLTLTLERPVVPYKAGSQEVVLPKLTGRYDGDFLDLAAVIRGEKEFDFPPAHDLAVQEALLRASGLEVK